jgi:hypothetical protein
MPLIPGGANYAAQMKALIEERFGLALSALIGFFFADKNFDLLGKEAAD